MFSQCGVLACVLQGETGEGKGAGRGRVVAQGEKEVLHTCDQGVVVVAGGGSGG